jgi:ligand-binding SRPBCC domain-containing protein
MTDTSCKPIRSPHGSLFKLRRDVIVPFARDEVFAFFSDAHNLDRITPPFLRFRVLSPRPIAMQVSTRIEYSLRLRGIPLRWTSEITDWDPPNRFVDTQIRGPYWWWQHEHRFEDLGDSTRVIDEVEYAPPGGRLVHALFVKRDLHRIFDFRTQSLAAIFARVSDKNDSPTTQETFCADLVPGRRGGT